MPLKKTFPGGLLVALRRRFQTVFLQKVDDGATRNLVTQIGERSLDSPVAPIPVRGGQPDHQLLDLTPDAGAPRPRRWLPSHFLAIGLEVWSALISRAQAESCFARKHSAPKAVVVCYSRLSLYIRYE